MFTENGSSTAPVLELVRAASSASLKEPLDSVTVTELADGKVSVAISETALTAAQQQAALQRLQQGLTDGSVIVDGLTVAGATWTTTLAGTPSLPFLQYCCKVTVYDTIQSQTSCATVCPQSMTTCFGQADVTGSKLFES